MEKYDFLKHVFDIGLYMAQEDGSIISKHYNKTRIMRPFYTKDYAFLELGHKGKKVNFYIHRIVYLYFNRDTDFSSKEINHIDGNKRNNALSNLELVTHSENLHHAYKNRLQTKTFGAASHRSKMTWDQALDIKIKTKESTTYKVAEEYGVSQSCIWNISSDRTFKLCEAPDHIKETEKYKQALFLFR
jgi:HNH endonuclease